jgi:serine O-acetyltransferase
MKEIWKTLKADFTAVRERDPALPRGFLGVLEAMTCYPGFHAIVFHRLTHFLHSRLHIPFLPRFLSQLVRWITGIEIHPGAKIGRGVFIDHGMGVVIGETAVVGDNVTLYQGVTLGGTGKDKGKRHPTLEEGALVGSGAKILGNIVIGENARIGAGSVVVRDVPPESTVVGVPGIVVRERGAKLRSPRERLNHGDLPEPLVLRLKALETEVKLLKERLSLLEDLEEDVTGSKEAV